MTYERKKIIFSADEKVVHETFNRKMGNVSRVTLIRKKRKIFLKYKEIQKEARRLQSHVWLTAS